MVLWKVEEIKGLMVKDVEDLMMEEEMLKEVVMEFLKELIVL